MVKIHRTHRSFIPSLSQQFIQIISIIIIIVIRSQLNFPNLSIWKRRWLLTIILAINIAQIRTSLIIISTSGILVDRGVVVLVGDDSSTLFSALTSFLLGGVMGGASLTYIYILIIFAHIILTLSENGFALVLI